jgi:IS6 family transposase
VVVFPWRDATAAPRFFERAIGTTKVAPVEVVTDRAATYPMVLQELLPPAPNRAIRQQPAEADHGRLKARLQLMRGASRTAPA